MEARVMICVPRLNFPVTVILLLAAAVFSPNGFLAVSLSPVFVWTQGRKTSFHDFLGKMVRDLAVCAGSFKANFIFPPVKDDRCLSLVS